MPLTWKMLAARINAMPESQQTLPVTCYNDYESEYQNLDILFNNETNETEIPVAYLMFSEHEPERHLNATWISEWEGGIGVRTKCHYDSNKNVVTDIEPSDIDGLDTLVREYVELPTGKIINIEELDEPPY